MKTKTKKAIALALCAVMLIAGTALTTVAYLTDSESVNNTFTVGEVHITLDEALVNEYGKPASSVTGEGENKVFTLVQNVEDARRVTTNEYKLVPGVTYVKDPTVHVDAKSEDCYVRILMTLNKQKELDTIFGPDGIDLANVFEFDTTGAWEYVGYTKNADGTERTYEFRHNAIVEYSKSVQDLVPLFTEFTCPTGITETQITDLTGFEINVVAHAIQEAGFDNPDAAWAAFDAQNNPPVQP